MNTSKTVRGVEDSQHPHNSAPVSYNQHDASTRSLPDKVLYSDYQPATSEPPSHTNRRLTNGAMETSDDGLLGEPEKPLRRASVHQKVSIFEHFVFKDVIGT